MYYNYPYSIATLFLLGSKLKRTLISVPDLKLEIEISNDEDATAFNLLGADCFIRNRILQKLEELDKEDSDFPEAKPLSYYQNVTYDLYLFRQGEKIDPKKISGKAIILQGKDSQFTAYYVDDHELLHKDNKILSVPILLNDDQIEKLSAAKTDKKGKVTKIPIGKLHSNENLLTGVIKQATLKANCPYGPQYTWTTVCVDYIEKNRYHTFETIFPWLIRSSVVAELGAGVPILTSGVRSVELTLFPKLDKHIADEIGLAQSILLSSLFLLLTFAGPAANSLDNVGIIIDMGFHKFWNFLRCKKTKKAIPTEPNCCTFLCVANYVSQILAFAAILDLLAIDASGDIQQLNAMSQMAAQMQSTLFSVKTLLYCIYIQFGANQINDPAMFISFFTFVKAGLQKLLRPKPKITPTTTERTYTADDSKRLPALTMGEFEADESKEVVVDVGPSTSLSSTNTARYHSLSEDKKTALNQHRLLSPRNSHSSSEEPAPAGRDICILM